MLKTGAVSVLNDVFVQLCSCCFSFNDVIFEHIKVNELMNTNVTLVYFLDNSQK